MAKMGNTGAVAGAVGTPILPTGGGSGGGLDLSSLFTRGAPGSILPERGSQAQRDMVLAALGSAFSSAPQSGSPLLAFLTPLLGGAVGARTEGLYDAVTESETGSATDVLLDAMGKNRTTPGTAGRVIYDGPGAPLSPRGASMRQQRNEAMASNGGPTVAAAEAMSGGAKGAAIYQGLVERGLPPHVAQGFVWNMQDESGLNPGINEANPIVPGSRGGFGLNQWTGSRRRGLEGFASARGAALDDTDMQLDYLVTELMGDESAAAQAIMATQTPEEAAATIVNSYLRPAEQHRAAREAKYLGGNTGVSYELPTMGGTAPMDRDTMAALLGIMTNERLDPSLQKLAGSMLGNAGGSTPSATDQLAYQKSWLDLQKSMQPDQGDPIKGVRVGDNLVDPYSGQVIYEGPADPASRKTIRGADGVTYYQDTGERVLPEGIGDAPSGVTSDRARQVNTAISNINSRVDEMTAQINPDTGDFYSRAEAIEATRADPLLRQLWAIVDSVQSEGTTPRSAAPARTPPADPTPPQAPAAPNIGGRGTGLPQPKSKQDYDALPSGTRFIDPEGTERVKP